MTVLRALVLRPVGTEAGRALALAARERVRLAGGTHLVAWSSHVLALIELGWGSLDQARRELEDGLELARALDYPADRRRQPAPPRRDRRSQGRLRSGGGARPRARFIISAGRPSRAALEALRSAAVVLAACGDREPAVRLLAGARGSPWRRRRRHRQARAARARGAGGRAAGVFRGSRGAHQPRRFRPRRRALGAAGRRRDLPPRRRRVDARLRRPRGPDATPQGPDRPATLLANPGREIHCLDLAR